MKGFSLRLPRKGLGSVVPAAVVAVGGIAAAPVSPKTAIACHEEIGYSLTEDVPTFDLNQVMGSSTVVKVRSLEDGEWTTDLENAFLELAKKEAVGTISETELEKLEAFSERRNKLKHHRSVDDLIFYAKQEQARVELLEAMSRFLKTYNQPRWKGATRNK